jgi:hypothetical protein
MSQPTTNASRPVSTRWQSFVASLLRALAAICV